MAVMLERWNDDKMDALEAKVGDLDRRMEKSFEKVDTELREQRRETKAGFEKVEGEMKAGFVTVEDRFHQMQWTLIGVAGAIIAALIAAPHL